MTDITPGIGHNHPPKARPMLTRVCPECGGVFETVHTHATFCATDCRKAFNNRRAVRGAMLYDLFMCLRFERGLAKVKGVWTLACALGHHFRDEDVAQRGGRKSWQRIEDVMNASPWLAAKAGRL